MVKLTITVDGSDQILNIELPDDFTVPDFLSYLESETSIPPSKQRLLYEGNLLQVKDKPTLSDLKLDDDCLIVLQKLEDGPPALATTAPTPALAGMEQQIEYLRQFYLSNPNTPIPDPSMRAILNNKERFHQEFRTKFGSQLSSMTRGGGPIAPGSTQNWSEEDEMNPENQARILEQINRQAIDDNMATAYELSPEAFTTIHMLYINVEVNGVPVKAFVDTGAQATIIAPELAEKTGLSRLIDKRFVGEARGVGSAKILGKIHSAPLKIGTGFFPCGFTVLKTDVQMLLGLDMLRRFQATVDLKQNKLLIGDVETNFLAENDCPKELNGGAGPQPSSQPSGFGGNIFSPGAGVEPAVSNSPQQQSASKRPKTSLFGGSPSVASRPPAATPSTAVVPDPAKVQQLMDLGCDKKTSEELLIQTNNNVDLAAGMLFG